LNLLLKISKKPLACTVFSIIIGLFFSSIILIATGYNPFEVFGVLLEGIFSRPKYIANVLIKSTPIMLTGLSVAFAFKTGLFNMGAEGQFIAGSIAAAIVGINFNLPAVLQVPIVLISGIIAGAFFGGLVGFLKAKFGIHEVISSIMFNWIAFYLSNFIVNLPGLHKPDTSGTFSINKTSFTNILYNWKNSKEGLNFLKKHPFFYETLSRTDLNYGIIFAIILAVFISFLLYNTKKGYKLRAVGLNSHAAEFSGINVKRNIIHAMLISGAISGLAGTLVVTGISPHNISTLASFENNGFNGLSVALIAGSSPIGCIFAGLLFGGLIYGGQSVQSKVGAPSEIINITIGIIVFFIAMNRILPKIIEKIDKTLNKRGEKSE